MDMKRRGCIYSEYTNDGRHRREGGCSSVRYVRGVGRVAGSKLRWVGEISYHKKRYRFRSTNIANVQAWLNKMSEKYSD